MRVVAAPVDLTAVAAVGVTVDESGLAFGIVTSAHRAPGSRMEDSVTAIVITGPTVPEVVVQTHFTAVDVTLIAIPEALITALDMTGTQVAARLSVLELMAVVAARPAVTDIAGQVGLASGAKLTVAARVSRLACTGRTDPSHTFTEDARCAIGTRDPATTAVVVVIHDIRFASVTGRAIAIAISRVATGIRAGSVDTDRGRMSYRVSTVIPTKAAVLETSDVGFASGAPVTICESFLTNLAAFFSLMSPINLPHKRVFVANRKLHGRIRGRTAEE